MIASNVGQLILTKNALSNYKAIKETKFRISIKISTQDEAFANEDSKSNNDPSQSDWFQDALKRAKEKAKEITSTGNLNIKRSKNKISLNNF